MISSTLSYNCLGTFTQETATQPLNILKRMIFCTKRSSSFSDFLTVGKFINTKCLKGDSHIQNTSEVAENFWGKKKRLIQHLSKHISLRVCPAVGWHEGFSELKAPCAADCTVTLRIKSRPGCLALPPANQLELNLWKTCDISGKCLPPLSLKTMVYSHSMPFLGVCQEELQAGKV